MISIAHRVLLKSLTIDTIQISLGKKQDTTEIVTYWKHNACAFTRCIVFAKFVACTTCKQENSNHLLKLRRAHILSYVAEIFCVN